MNFADYAEINAVNASLLKRVRESLAHAKHYLDNPEPPSRAMIKGSAAHTGILEPGLFDSEVAVFYGARRGPEWLAFQAAHGAKPILTPAEYESVNGMIGSAINHPDAHGYLYGPGKNEMVIMWTDKRTGLRCKARVDRLILDPHIMVEVKTTRSIDPRRFSSQCSSLGYWLQLAFCADGLAQCGYGVPPCFVVAIESEPPYNAAVFEIGETELSHGRSQYENALDQLIGAYKSGEWPGPYESGSIPLRVPNWDIEETDQETADWGV